MLERDRLITFLFDATSDHELMWQSDLSALPSDDGLSFLDKLHRYGEKISVLTGLAINNVVSLPENYFAHVRISYEVPCKTTSARNAAEAIMVDYEYLKLRLCSETVSLYNASGRIVIDSEEHPLMISLFYMVTELSVPIKLVGTQNFYLKANGAYHQEE